MDLVGSEGRRGGTRGGRDQFNWEDVKSDKDRENYLGHSVKAGVGRWQDGRDVFWYAEDTRARMTAEVSGDSSGVGKLTKEVEEIRRRERRLVEAMARKPNATLSEVVKQEMLLRVTGEKDTEAGDDENLREHEERKRRKQERKRIREERARRRAERADRAENARKRTAEGQREDVESLANKRPK